MYRDSKSGIAFHDGVIWRSMLAVRFNQLLNILFAALYLFLAACFLLEYLQVRRIPAFDYFAQCVNARLPGIVRDGHDPAGHPIAWLPLIVIGMSLLVHRIAVALIRHIGRRPSRGRLSRCA